MIYADNVATQNKNRVNRGYLVVLKVRKKGQNYKTPLTPADIETVEIEECLYWHSFTAACECEVGQCFKKGGWSDLNCHFINI